jgi:hypothetical protein
MNDLDPAQILSLCQGVGNFGPGVEEQQGLYLIEREIEEEVDWFIDYSVDNA